MPRFDPEVLVALATELVGAMGAPRETASSVAESLVDADRRGRSTHGIGLLSVYDRMVADGAIDPDAEPSVVRGSRAATLVEGRGAFGQVTARVATREGIALARESGVGVVGIRDGTHLGRLGEWAELAAREGAILLAFTNTGGGARNVAAAGGSDRRLSTNPVAFGIPTFDGLPYDVVLDIATSQVSGSAIREARRRGESLDPAWTTTERGDPVETAADFTEGAGALLPLGGRATGHKGYGLAVVAELLAGLVGTAPVVGEADPEWFSNGSAFVLVDPTVFSSVDRIEATVRALADHIHAEDGVRLPGERSHRRAERARERGIDVDEGVLVSLCGLAIDRGIEDRVPEPVRAAIEEGDREPSSDEDPRTW